MLSVQVHQIASIMLEDPHTIGLSNGSSFVTRRLVFTDFMGTQHAVTLFGPDAKALTVRDQWAESQATAEVEQYLTATDGAARRASVLSDPDAVREHIL